jgi:hypothetical protein
LGLIINAQTLLCPLGTTRLSWAQQQLHPQLHPRPRPQAVL